MRHGSNIDPPNRFEKVRYEPDLEQLEWDQEHLRTLTNREIEYIDDVSRTIVSENDSPDIPFRFSLNPYRGCVHGCAYCYARPTHEYFGLSAGLDFETRIFVKHQAANLFRDALARKDWEPQPVMFSGVTDCYQPAERQFALTRQCLEVALEAHQPVWIVTKNALVVRDLDVLSEMAARNIVNVSLSVTTLDQQLAAIMEPRTSTIAARLRAIRELSSARVPVHAMTAPIIPGLNDSELPHLLEQVAAAGALSASYILLRLPLTVQPIFRDWLQTSMPTVAPRVEQRIQSTRGGQWSSSQFGQRMRGDGPIADQIRQTFRVFSRRYGLDRKPAPLDSSQFRPPSDSRGQRTLF